MTTAAVRRAPPALALALGIALTRLRARLRSEQASVTTGLTMSQLSVLGRLEQLGPATASAIAQAEHVRAQSVAETVAVLRRQGLVVGQPDPSDGRKVLLSLTDEGVRLVAAVVHLRDAWLARAIERHTTQAERDVLAEAAEVLARLAACDLESSPDESWRP